MAAAAVVLGLAGSVPVAVAAIAVLAVGSLVASIVMETLFQRIVPDEVRGRALGISGTVRVLAMIAGSLLIPLIATAIGVDGALVTCAAIIVGSSVVGVLALGPYAVQVPTVDPRLAVLSALPMLAGVPPGRIETAERRARIVPMRSGEVVIRQGAAADRFYVIAEGAVEVTQAPEAGGEARLLRRLAAGEGFGEIGLLRGAPRSATVTAVEDGSLVELDGPDFLELVSGAGIVSPFVDQQRGPTYRHAEVSGG
jgi:MFS family permease